MLCSGCEAYADLMRNSNNAMLRKDSCRPGAAVRKDAGDDEKHLEECDEPGSLARALL